MASNTAQMQLYYSVPHEHENVVCSTPPLSRFDTNFVHFWGNWEQENLYPSWRAKYFNANKNRNNCGIGSSKIQFFTNIWHPFWRRLLRPREVKKVWNSGSSINSHFSGSHWASVLVDLSKHLVNPGLYFVSISNGWPCMYHILQSKIKYLYTRSDLIAYMRL